VRARTILSIFGLLALPGAAGYLACRAATPRIAYVGAEPALVAAVEEAARGRGVAVAAVRVVAPPAEDTAGRDDAADVALAEAAVGTPGVVAVVGHPRSRGALLAAPIYGEAGLPFVAPTATSRRLRDAGPWIFPLAPDDEAEGAFIAAFALDSLAARRITVFYLVADEYGIGLREGIARALRARGVAPADEVGVLDDSDFERRVAASLRRHATDAVVLAVRTPEALAIGRAVRRRLPRAPIVLADGVDNAAYTGAAGEELGPVTAVAWWRPDSPDSASRAFVRRFERATGRLPRQHDAMYYDAFMVAAEAVRVAGGRPDAVRRYLRELGTSRPAWRGVTGPISFAPGRPTNLVMVRLTGAAAAPVGAR
jgi:branched-chain amino acid transport system substrate-binding protein